MKNIRHIDTVDFYNKITDNETKHPLVSVIDFSKYKKKENRTEPTQALSFGFYSIFFKEDRHCDIRYGRNYYDYQDGTLIFIAPGQVVSIEEDGEDYVPNGYALLFHPDLLKGTSLAQHMKDFSFFSYHIHEALHISEQEKEVIMESLRKIEFELSHAIDKHSKRLIAANIELLLSYCIRFYDRQFITRDNTNSSILEKFEVLLNDYFQSDNPQTNGIPGVAFFANELNLSANYFGDLIKKETGKTAQEHIQLKLLDVAKIKIFNPGKLVSQVAHELGFKYPQHFTRFFKQHLGYSPNDYRMLK